MISVKSIENLKQLKNHEDGELACVEDTKEIFRYSQESDEWLKNEENGLKMKIVDLNKMAIAGLPDYTEEEIEKSRILIDNTFNNFKYCMLLSNELSYYTVFHCNKEEAEGTIGEMTIACVQDWGTIRSISKEDSGAIEIWISTYETNEIKLFYLFDYAKGVIECL